MNVAFRVDASPIIGTGHLYRCLTLAQTLVANGHSALFVMRHIPQSLGQIITDAGFDLIRLPAMRSETVRANWCAHAGWLEASWQDDAASTKEVLDDRACEWLVVDHYALDTQWQAAVRDSVGSIMVIDDLADRNHSCDLLLDHNYVDDFSARYDKLVPDSCERRLGPGYALLRPEFLRTRMSVHPRNGALSRILVFVGGVDNANKTSVALRGIESLDSRTLTVDVVVGSANPHRHEIEMLSRRVRGCRLFGRVESLAPLMGVADLAIGAAGTTTWERCCLGLPSLTMSIADNQIPIAEGSQLGGFAVNLGKGESVTAEVIARGIEHLLNNPTIVQQMSLAGMRLVDGRGADRVAQSLVSVERGVKL
jgi:UDP-2,4-diacetamido-2,4,6-trideoxy-beta-L-altropyranose hydrolase